MFGLRNKTPESVPVVRRSRARKPFSVRSFLAGLPSRLTSSWTPANTAIDQDIHASLETLRARSRDLAQNNEFAKKYLQMVQTHVVGPDGFTLQVQATDANGQSDSAANRLIESEFRAWSQRGTCDVTGQYSFVDLQHLILSTVARDGAALVRRVRGNHLNPYGYALQLLDIDRLDVNDNRTLSNGNVVRMGVEIDSFGRPVAYHLRQRHPGESLAATGQGQVERVPARDMFHIYRAERPEQRRGVPWMHAAMTTLYHLREFEQSALVAARKGADTLGFFVSPDGAPPDIGDEEDADGNPIELSVPGTYDTIPEGYDFKPYASQYPDAMVEAFVKMYQRKFASGVNVCYHSLSNDLTDVNFSSIRAGTLEERDYWMVIQNWFASAFLRTVYLDWLQTALGSALNLPAANYRHYSTHHWQGRRWDWVDPKKDMEAALLAKQHRLKSSRRIMAAQGVDLDSEWQQIAEEERLAGTLFTTTDNNTGKDDAAKDQL